MLLGLYRRKILLTLKNPYANTCLYLSWQRRCYNQEKANMVVSRLFLPRASWVVAYRTLHVRSQQQGINFDGLSFWHTRVWDGWLGCWEKRTVEENEGWKVMRKFNKASKVNLIIAYNADVILLLKTSSKAVGCRKVQKGKGRCGEQPGRDPEKRQTKYRAAGWTAGTQRPASSNCGRAQHQTRHPSRPPRTPLYREFVCLSESATHPPDPLYHHYVCNNCKR